MSEDDLSEAEKSLAFDDSWEFIQMMSIRGIKAIVIIAAPCAPHVIIGKTMLETAAGVLRDCAARIDTEYGVPQDATRN